jgi:hypothetical protein
METETVMGHSQVQPQSIRAHPMYIRLILLPEIQ